MKSFKWVVLMVVLVLTMSMVSLKPAQPPVCSLAPVGYHDTEAMVLAAYQVWFGLESHRLAFSGECLPPEKWPWPYDSRDPEVIARHIQEAKARGIDAFIVDWYGPKDDVTGVWGDEREFMDLATQELFRQAEENDFLVALMYDDQTVKYAVPDDCDSYLSRVKEDLQYAKERYFGSPAYLKINDCPALFIFPDDHVKECLYNKWGEIKEHLGDPVTLLDRDPNPQDEPEYDAQFDGFFAWVTATKGQWHPDGLEWGREYLEWFYRTMQSESYADKVAVGGVWPGFDDSLAPWSENRFIARRGTLTHDETLERAEDSNVEYIMVGTWNDFEEGTDIEYGVRMRVDMEKPDPEVLIRSTPVLVCWSSDIGSAPLQVYTGCELIYEQEHSPGVYLSLTPRNLYELKLWTSGDDFLSKLIKIRRIDPVPGVVPEVVEPNTIKVTSPKSGESWQVDSSQNITWTNTGSVGNVKIQYSVNNGCDWSTITSSTENYGSYNWTVPDTPSEQCLIRISETDGVPAGTSAMFSIVPIPRVLTLRSPNGGESWLAGSQQEIRWSSTGDINNVTLQYSKDNGATWKTIVQSTGNDGSYDWLVPYKVSDECLVRVTANDSDLDPKPSDISDAVFSIILPAVPNIRVTAPNGGEQLQVDSRFTITWVAAGFREEVKIEYSTNGGDAYEVICSAAENNGKFDWLVPDTPSDTCLVRISKTGGEPVDVSDEMFSIVSQSQSVIRVLSPNGGENWEVDSLQEIKWTCTGDINNVTIAYSHDNGTTWKQIVQTTPNDGSFEWTVPDAVSDLCLVRVTSADGDPDPKPSDVSDDVFSIVLPSAPTIRVIAPNGGEQLLIGSRFNITWYGSQSREKVKIEYSTNGADTWIIISEETDNDGEYDWTIPDTPSETCLVRISETDGDPVDVSDAVFSIVPPLSDDITVISPNGGESWAVGSSQEIKWTCTGDINNVTIEYSTDNGATWRKIIQTTPNDGSFDWTVPNAVSDECLVRITSNDGDPDPRPSDVSDNVFSIIPSIPGEFRVTSPNGGESWEVGSLHPVTWTSSGEITSVKIDYSFDGGNTWTTVVSSTNNDGSYDWQVPDTVSDSCLVRVTANDGGGDPKPSDVSDEEFAIVLPQSPTIRVIAPNGGEELTIGTVFKISWFGSNSREPVKIEFSTNGGDDWDIISSATENDGEYDWTVPDKPSDICLIRISETDGEPVDVSDAVFSIVPPIPGDLTVLTPNGGENLETGSEYNISWDCSGLNNVIIEYSVNNGITYMYIDTVPADNGYYLWTVPATPSQECLVRISGVGEDENPVDVSDEVFTIFDPSQAFIEVLTPNGGESLSVGVEYYITWASEGVAEVFIEYSLDYGDEWIPIDTVPAIGGRYTWTVPNSPSDTCLIRISAVPSGEPLDMSDAVFSIKAN